MKPYQERVLGEKCDLDVKIDRLDDFFSGPEFVGLSPEEKGRLLRQRSVMKDYSSILGERIAAFTPETEPA